MNLLDRITLLRAGYSRKEIDQMIADDAAAAAAAAEPEEAPEPETDPEPEETPEPEEPEPDYKKLYEAQTAALEKAQAANRQRDNKGKDKDPQEVLNDIVASFL